MTPQPFVWHELGVIFPELYLVIAALGLLMYGVYRAQSATPFALLMAAVALAGTVYLALLGGGERAVIFNGLFLSDHFTLFSKLALLTAALLVLLLSSGWLLEEQGRPFEFVILMLFAVLGLMLLISANDIMSLYVALELSSLSLYVLAAFSRDSARSSEAGLKYFVLGALASGMLLFGASLIYGFAGTTGFAELAALFGGRAEAVAAKPEALASYGLITGMVFIVAGFCFKLSAVPFHMWTPDVYEGAPTPVTAFFAVAPKVAGMALFLRLMSGPFGDLMIHWQQVLALIAVASMAVGALGALMQTNIKRLLAYSSIGHVGFMLMGLAAGNRLGAEGVLVYLALYVFMNAGAFGCVLLMRREGAYVEQIRDLSGLSRTHPVLALALAIFMFSMAGIPPLAGFFGKLYVLIGVVESGLIWLAVLGVAASVIACYYYLKVVKVMYFDDPAPGFDSAMPLPVRFCLGVSAAVTLFFFLTPRPLLAQARAAAESLLM